MLVDAYQVPYSRQHRYWTGLMLITRCILYLSFTTSHSDNSLPTNMFITILVILGILVFKSVSTSIYRRFYLNLLELFFLANLGALSATVYYAYLQNSPESTVCKILSASITLSLLAFFGILAYHAYLQVKRKKLHLLMKSHFLHKWLLFQERSHDAKKNSLPLEVSGANAPTTSVVELSLRETLLEDQEAGKL